MFLDGAPGRGGRQPSQPVPPLLQCQVQLHADPGDFAHVQSHVMLYPFDALCVETKAGVGAEVSYPKNLMAFGRFAFT